MYLFKFQAKLFLLKPSDGSMSPSIDFYFYNKTSSSNKKKNFSSLKLVDSASGKNPKKYGQPAQLGDVNMPSTSQL